MFHFLKLAKMLQFLKRNFVTVFSLLCTILLVFKYQTVLFNFTRLVHVPNGNKIIPEHLAHLLKSQYKQDRLMFEKYFYKMDKPGVFVEFGNLNNKRCIQWS